jgi:hypothetical protein
VRCLCPTYFYTEWSTYRTLLFTPLMALRHCGEWASTSVCVIKRLGKVYCTTFCIHLLHSYVGKETLSWLHLYYTTKVAICQEVFEKNSQLFFG